MAVINTNVKALFSQAALTTSGRAQQLAMQQLSTGKRINSARDDAAGMAIATRMTQQIRGLNQAVRNAGDAINLIQTAEGATNEITDMMQRMRELAVQAVNDTNDNAQRSYLDLEFQQLKQQIVQISNNTEWNGFPVLNGTAGQRVGEMPVYKVTSDNQFGSVFINPTTSRTIAGTDSGKVQTMTIGGIPPSLSTESSSVTFTQGLNSGQSITIGGLKFTATSSLTSTQVATAFANVVNGAQGASTLGTYSGQLTGFSSGAVSNGVINFTSNIPGANVADLAISVDSTLPSTPTVLTTQGGTGATTETSTLTFSGLAAGQSVTVGGLTFTATSALIAADVAAAFANIANGASSGSSIGGVYSGTLSGFSSAGVTAPSSIVFASSTLNTNVSPDLAFSVGPTAPIVNRSQQGSSTSPEINTVTFSGLAANQSVTVGGLTFTANSALNPAAVAAAFANIATGATSGSSNSGVYSGILSGFSSLAVSVPNTGVITFTSATNKNGAIGVSTNPTAPTSAIVQGNPGVSESTALTFPALSIGQSVTVGGLTYTANSPLIATQVASAFAGLSDGATAGSSPITDGSYTGVLTGFTTTGSTGNPLTFSSTVAGNVTDLAFSVSATKPIPPQAIVVQGGSQNPAVIKIKVAGVDIPIDSAASVSTAAIATRIQQTLSNDPSFNASSGRSVQVSGNTLTFTYSAADGDVKDTSFSNGAAVGLTAAVTTARDVIAKGNENFKANGAFLNSGALSMSVDANGKVTASFKTTQGQTIPMQGVLNNNAVTETSVITFNSMTAGQTLTMGGLTYTAGPYGANAAQVAADFANRANGYSGASGITPTNGTFTGTLSNFASGSVNLDGSVTFTSASTGTNVTNLSISGSGALPNVVTVDGAPAGSVTFIRSAGSNAQVISDDLVYTFQKSDATAANLAGRSFNYSVAVEGSIPALRSGDLKINGINIGASYATDDTVSPPGNAAGSAIAKAAAINRMSVATGVTQGETQMLTFSGTPAPGNITVGGVTVTLTALDKTSAAATAKIAAALQASPLYGASTGRIVNYSPGNSNLSITYAPSEGNMPDTVIQSGPTGLTGIVDTTAENFISQAGTGVFAKVNENVMTGKAMSGASVVKGTVFINGYASADITTTLNNSRQTRADVVRAINLISDKTGVKAIDTGSDAKGITLSAADGRNIEVSFETNANGDDFGSRIGLRQGVQASTISLESKIPAPVVLTSDSTGDITRAGLISGNFSKNEAVANTAPRPIVSPDMAQIESVSYSGTPPSLGDTFSLTVNGTTFTYTAGGVGGTDPLTTQAVRDGLVELVNKNSTLPVTATAGRSNGEVLLTANSAGTSFTLTNSKSNTTTTVATAEVQANVHASFKPLGLNDLVINGVKIPASNGASDKDSNTIASSSDPASSALAIAAAINSQTPLTGVLAKANGAEVTGTKTDTSLPILSSPTYESLFVNGTEIKVQFVQNESNTDRLNKVADAINARSGEHGVVAVNNGNGISLKSDGRNLSVWFDSNVKDLSAANFGLDQGGAVAQSSQISFSGTVAATDTATVTINGVKVTSAAAGTPASTAELATALQAAINAAITSGAIKNISVTNNSGILSVTSTVPGSAFDISGAGTNTTSATGSALSINQVTANSFGNNQVTGIRNATATSTTARTVYGTVRMIAQAPMLPDLPKPIGAPPSEMDQLLMANAKPFTVSSGDDGFGPNSNFSALGFNEGSFGGRSSSDMDPPKVGRLAFQVGSSANQTVTIDLADFGKDGPITGEITGDVDQNIDQRTVRINTRDGATAVLAKLDSAMDKVNATRATMGAVMNRLDHVINNLTNVSMNLSTSRSGIEDADYASSSTELAKTQIMQQAATAVLAQANTSQQTVLKLLGG